MKPPPSPLSPTAVPKLQSVPGVGLAVAESGDRYKERPDLLLMTFAPGTNAAGVFTRSTMPGAPVVWSKRGLRESGGRIRALLVNAGNANAFTGRQGLAAVERLATAVAKEQGCPPEEVLMASTGVIGVPLRAERLEPFLPTMAAGQRASGDAWGAAAEAIRTTDTFPKAASRQCGIDGVNVTLTGIAKGSGMIQPNMGTMLSFVATDANIPAIMLQGLLMDVCDRTFNAITVDSDTSTSDTLILAATGQARHQPVRHPDDPRLAGFRESLEDLLRHLAVMVVRDGEGAQMLISDSVVGAENDAAAKQIAFAIANSPLVKTAIAGSDANWGRIVMAVGKSGERADPERLTVYIGGIALTRDGARVPDYDEAPVTRHLQGQEIEIDVDVGVGRGEGRVWTCDLTHGYIDINADYRS